MHHINQLHPQGADKDYANGAYNCGPAVVAMLARATGQMGHLNDAQLVQQLGNGLVTRQGSSPEGITRMLERANVPLGGEALGAGYSNADLKDHLLKGHKLIAQVRSSNSQSNKDSAHYVVVEGMTREGNYIISDPLSKKPYTVSPQKLKEAVLKAPPDGGMLIPVASPERKPAAQALAAAPTGTGAGARKPDAFMGPVAPQAPAAAKRVDTFIGPAPSAPASPVRAPALSVPTAPAPLLFAPAAAGSLSVPEEKAFTATEEVFEGVDTKFKETDSEPTDARMAKNEERNKFDLDIRYGRDRGPDEGPKRTVTSDGLNLGEFIENLVKAKSRGDEKAYQTLSDLESSTSKQDKQVLKEIKQSDKKDPGIGVKTMGDAF